MRVVWWWLGVVAVVAAFATIAFAAPLAVATRHLVVVCFLGDDCAPPGCEVDEATWAGPSGSDLCGGRFNEAPDAQGGYCGYHFKDVAGRQHDPDARYCHVVPRGYQLLAPTSKDAR